jgi:hypothetical protein
MVPDECQLPSSMYNIEYRKGIEDLFADSIFRIKFCNQIIVYQNLTAFSGNFFYIRTVLGIRITLFGSGSGFSLWRGSGSGTNISLWYSPDADPAFYFHTDRLFIKVMRIFNPWPTDPSQLNCEGWTSKAPFNTSTPPGFLNWSGSSFYQGGHVSGFFYLRIIRNWP